jgi:hypothetical protein
MISAEWRDRGQGLITMKMRLLKVGVIAGGGLVLAIWTAPAQTQTNIAPKAERVLAAACQYLAQAPHFSLTAEIWREHVTASGQKLQFSRTVHMEVKRPAGLHLDIDSPHSQRGFWYDGKALTILDRQDNFYSAAPMPGTLDAMLDEARDKYGIDLPLSDLAVTDPYKNATAKVVKGTYYGLSPVLGINCHHLAFTQDNVDWQVWIEDGPQPFIRKFVITHKNEEGAREFTAFITHWDFTQRISDLDFAFEPPHGATKIEMRKDQFEPDAGEHAKPAPLSSPKNK